MKMNKVYMIMANNSDVDKAVSKTFFGIKNNAPEKTEFEDILYNIYVINGNYYGIRPVIRTDGDIMEFIKANNFQASVGNEFIGGMFPQKIVTSPNLRAMISDKIYEDQFYNIDDNNKGYTILLNNKFVFCKSIKLMDEEYIYVRDKHFSTGEHIYVQVCPMHWIYDKNQNCLISKDIITGFNGMGEQNAIRIGETYLNDIAFSQIFDGQITSLTNKAKVININNPGNNELYKFGMPFQSYFCMDEKGALVSHDENEFDINIENCSSISTGALKTLHGKFHKRPVTFNLNINGDNIKINPYALDFNALGTDVRVNNFTVVNKLENVDYTSFIFNFPFKNARIPCDINLFTSLFANKNLMFDAPQNCLRGSNLTITYNDEEELISFIQDMQSFVELFPEKIQKMDNSIGFSYKNKWYGYHNYVEENYSSLEKSFIEKLGVTKLTFMGPLLNKERVIQLLGSAEKINFSFVRQVQKEKTNEQKPQQYNNENTNLSKEAQHILKLAKEIASIHYIGLDKEYVRKQIDEIVNEYNNGLSKKTEGLSLNTNEGVYTTAIIKLEKLRDSLYHDFHKNMEYYNIIDLIGKMIKKVNGEEINLDYEILKDLDTLNKILDYNKDNNTRKELITYLENESQRIIDYLKGKKELDYRNIDEFVKKFRLFLVPILTRVSGDVSKNDTMEQIKNYALKEMNGKSMEYTNSYIEFILNEINKVKHDILSLDRKYTFEELDYSSFKTGKEIIDYLDKKYIEYYKVYLELMRNKENEENYENSKVPLSY